MTALLTAASQTFFLPAMVLCEASLGYMPWIVWAIVGIVGGYMAGRLLRPDLSSALYMVVGIAGAILGGWCYTLVFGTTDQDVYVSLLSSVVVCALFLWVACKMTPTDISGDGDEDQ